MPYSDEDMKIGNEPKSSAEQEVPASLLLRFRRPMVVVAHILVFAASLMLSMLLANNMQFKRDWLVEHYPMLLFFFIIIKLPVFGFFKQFTPEGRVAISEMTVPFRFFNNKFTVIGTVVKG